MIIVPIKEGENIERALKRYKRKYNDIGIVRDLRKRQAFQKPSDVNRRGCAPHALGTTHALPI